VLDGGQPQHLAADRSRAALDVGQPVLPDQRGAGAADQAAPALLEPGAPGHAQSRQGHPHPDAPLRHLPHPHSLQTRAQGSGRNALSALQRLRRLTPGQISKNINLGFFGTPFECFWGLGKAKFDTRNFKK